MKANITIVKATGNHPVFCRYEGQNVIQPAYLELDPDSRTAHADYSADLGGAISSAEFYHRVVTFGINPRMKTSAINRLLSAVSSDMAIVCDGYSIYWDGNNYVGRYDESAQKAIQNIRYKCEEFDTPSNLDMRV